MEITFNDDPVMGTYPAFGRRATLLKYFRHRGSLLMLFASRKSDPEGSNDKNRENAVEFIRKNPDWQIYTITTDDVGKGLYMERGWHYFNSMHRYVAVLDRKFRTMKYV